jgi:hypothetical protein
MLPDLVRREKEFKVKSRSAGPGGPTTGTSREGMCRALQRERHIAGKCDGLEPNVLYVRRTHQMYLPSEFC